MEKVNVLILPASEWVVPLIMKAKKMDYNVFVVNPYEDSPGFKYADKYLISDIFDYEKVIKFAKENNINAIASDECDIAMPAIAKIGKALGLPAISEKTATIFQDKFEMREFCRSHNIKFPEYQLCFKAEDAIKLFKKIEKPLIIKPLDNCSSRGVFKVSSVEEIQEHFEESLAFSHFHKAVLAERYINGPEFTVDSVKTPSRNFSLAISEKKHFAHNSNIANELFFSHYNNNYDYDKLRSVNDAYVMQSGMEFGFTHAEYKFEDGDFYLIEIGARGGGNMISSSITQYLSGYDTYRYLLECSAGNIRDEDFSIKDEYKNRAAVLKFFSTPNGGGVVKNIDGLDYLEREKDVAHYRFNFKVGDTIIDALNDATRVGFYIATCENKDRLHKLMTEVENNVKIIIE
jgi:biotin carboxylase